MSSPAAPLLSRPRAFSRLAKLARTPPTMVVPLLLLLPPRPQILLFLLLRLTLLRLTLLRLLPLPLQLLLLLFILPWLQLLLLLLSRTIPLLMSLVALEPAMALPSGDSAAARVTLVLPSVSPHSNAFTRGSTGVLASKRRRVKRLNPLLPLLFLALFS